MFLKVLVVVVLLSIMLFCSWLLIMLNIILVYNLSRPINWAKVGGSCD